MKNIAQLCSVFLSILLTIAVPVHAAESDRLFAVHDTSEGLADNGAQVIVCTKTGRMVICSIGHINFYNGSSFDHIDASTEDIYELSNYEGRYQLYFDKTHHLWIKDKNQVTCVDLLTERFISDVQGVFKQMGFDKKVEDLFVDDDGCLLLLSHHQLYNCKTKKSYPVRNGKRLQNVGEYNDLLLLFYDDGSIEAFNALTGRLVYMKSPFDKHFSNKYNKTSLLLFDNGYFYQLRNGEKEAVLMHINIESGECRVLMELPYHMNNMAIHDSLLYVATQNGYWTYRPSTGEKQHYGTLRTLNYQDIETDINDIAFDLQGGMWVGTEEKGLFYSKPYTSPFVVYPWTAPESKRYAEMLRRQVSQKKVSLPRRVNCVYRDSRGWIWQGTFVGLKRYLTADDKSPLVINNHDGLNNNVIHSIIEDNDHNLWVSTSNGISCLLFGKDTLERVVSFNEDDNIPTSSFVNGLAMKLEDGSIIMQSLDYIVKFNPAQFHTTKRPNIKLYPKLIRLSVNGRTIHAGMELDGKVILDRAVTRAKEFNVNYNQNTISLLFSGLNFFRPTQTYYRIRVKGFKNEWEVFSMHDGSGRVDEKGMLHYPIIGIPPGEYEIEVQTSMSPDEWPVDPFMWKLNVDEPWWRMTIVYVTLALILLGMLIANFVYFNKNTRLKLNRNNIEGGVIRRVKSLAEMCENMEKDVLSPVSELENIQELDDMNAFTGAMMKVLPYVDSHPQDVSMTKLAKVAQMDLDKFYGIMSTHLYKTPRSLVLRLRLQKAADMLSSTDKSVEEIAEDLNFESPNYLIASFYHLYRQTPDDYRATNPR